jgi:hypothetical protein
MDETLNELRAECERAAENFLAIENWGSAKSRARAALGEMIAGSKLATSSMAWLVGQTPKLPVHAEPSRRLHEFVLAVAALRAREAQLAALSDDAPDFCPTSDPCGL